MECRELKGKPCFQQVAYCVFFPFIFVWYSMKIYCFPCIGSYLERCFCAFICFICCCCRSCCHHKDSSFPPDTTSLGEWKGKSKKELERDIEWRKSDDMYDPKHEEGDSPIGHMSLFEGSISPNDVGQGQLGDCWLMSAIASLAEHPGALQKLFVDKQYQIRGKYNVRIYDSIEKKWIVISVDDYFPCSVGTDKPIFAQPKGNELWVLILEKVFAKFCGSYHALAGGNAIWALKAMTGDQIFSFMHKGGKWERNELVHIESKHSKRAVGYRATKDQLSETDMFDMCKHYYERESILAASSLSGTDSKEESKQGLVQGHAYTVVELKEVGGFRMICLRNPWGSFEWTGSWSDSSILWDKNPKVKKACKPDLDHTNDGMFWMEWSDFSSNFRKIDICARSTGIKDLELDLNEEAGCIGPCKGCFQGCLGYYLCCRGCKAFCCAKEAVFDDDHSEFVSIKVDKGEVQRSEPAAKSSNPFA